MLEKRLKIVAVATGISLALTGGAWATSLQEAIALAYQNNPALVANRAALRSQDESVAQASAGFMPSLSAEAVLSRTDDLDIGTDDPIDMLKTTLRASLLLFDGGQTADAIKSAENSVFAGQQNLYLAEQGVMLKAAIAYLDVRRDTQFVALARNNVRVIEQQVQATKDRFEVGAVTRTEVALVEAQLAAAKTNLAAKIGALAFSQEVYRSIIGIEPENLNGALNIPALPSSQAEAESIAIREHPSIKAARFNETAAEFDLSRARSSRAPVITLGATAEYKNTTGFFGGEDTTGTIYLSGQMPIYQGGALSSAMRMAEQVLLSRKATTQDAMRTVRQSTAVAWANIRVANASIYAGQLQIEATQIAYNGIEEEVRLGARTSLDLLDAEQDLLSAKSSLASSRRDLYVAKYNLLAAMGLLTIENLELGIPAYDPNVNFNQVRNAPLVIFKGGQVLDGISDRWE